MNEKDFFDRFIKLLENTKERYELNNLHDALIVWFGENYLFLDPEDVKERIVKDTHAEGVDAILIDDANYHLLFIQAQTVSDFNNTNRSFPENDVKSTLEGIRFLLRGDYKGKITPELENLVDEYHEKEKTGDYETEILFITLKRKIDSKFVEKFKKDFPQVKVKFYDFDWLFDFFTNFYLIRRAKPPERISLEVITELLRKDIPHKSRVFTCKGKELAKIYNDYRERIFQQNVRYFLGLRSKSINKQILETATDSAKSKYFWYFNNGITIVCKEINEPASGKIVILKDAQIINGAQTTYALYEAYKSGTLRDDVEVLIKVIETDDRNFLENVTLYTNSQNAIRLRDLCSNDEIQLKVQKILLDSYRYFYERKRGEFESLHPTIEAKRKLLGDDFKIKVISNENAAQAFLGMYLDKPAQAKSEKGRIFLKDKTGFYDSIFSDKDSILAEKLLLSWRLLKYIEKKKKEYSNKYKQAEKMPENQKNKIYEYDFLLHSEYFILNIFKDFLKNKGFDIDTKKDDILKIISKIDSNDNLINESYEAIEQVFKECINEFRKQPGYYHNKFFKNEKSIGLVRSSINKKYNFVEVI
jgi:hypothetical protein